MSDPVIYNLVADTWTKVVSSTKKGEISILSNAPNNYIYTYREAGATAPTDKSEGVSIVDITKKVDEENYIDAYIMSLSAGGIIRADFPVSGYSVTNKFGENSDIDTATVPEVIASIGGTFPFLDAGISIDVVSLSVNDTLLGTGARTLRVQYYSTDNTEKTKDIDLNGVTRVEFDDDVKIITRAGVIASGTLKTNDGRILFVGRATGLINYQAVEINEGQTLSCVQICPKNKKGKVKCHTVTYARTANNNSAQCRLRLRQIDGSVLTKHNATITTLHAEDTKEYGIGGISMAAGEILFWECVEVSANDTPIEARFDIEFQDI